MTDTTAQILAKGCQSTGITEELAGQLHDQLGMKLMCIVELVSQDRGENLDGKECVQLKILSVEPATDNRDSDHLRDLQRAMYHGRKLHDEDAQPQLDGVGDVEPTADQVIDRDRGTLPTPPDGDQPPWEYPQGEGQPAGDQEHEEEPVHSGG